MNRFPALTEQLSNRDGFLRLVKFHSAATRALRTVLVIACALLAYNIFSSVASILSNSTPSEYWVDVFMSTTNTRGQTDPFLVLYVWGPIVLIPVLLVALFIENLSRRGSVDKAVQGFVERGFLSTQYLLGFQYKPAHTNGALYTPYFYASPLVPDELVLEHVVGLSNYAHSLQGKELKEFRKQMEKVPGSVGARDARAFFEWLPAGLYIAGVQGALARKNAEEAMPYLVIPQATGTDAKVYKLRKGTLVG